LLGLVRAQGKFNGEQAQVGCGLIVWDLGQFDCRPPLSPHHRRLDKIHSIAELILVEPVFVSPHFIPRDCGTVDFLQLSYHPASLFWVERRRKSAELNAAMLLRCDLLPDVLARARNHLFTPACRPSSINPQCESKNQIYATRNLFLHAKAAFAGLSSGAA
jgi:hypothetical protein